MQQVVTGVFWLANVNSTILVVEIFRNVAFLVKPVMETQMLVIIGLLLQLTMTT